MAVRRHAHIAACTGVTLLGVALAGAAPAAADPTDPPPTPGVIYPVDAPPPPPPPAPKNPMTPHQPPVPAAPSVPAPGAAAPAAPPPADPAGPPPADPAVPPPVMRPSVPEIPNAQYGSGNGGGILGSIMDLWHQAQNPFLGPDSPMGPGGMPTPPPGAGPAPALPPGYVSTNAPGSETPATAPAAGAETGRPALPPGYYPIDGPPPPWYTDPAAAPAPGT